MYCVISWDISASEPRWSAINEQMRKCFNGLKQVRPVNTYYMVKVTGENQYDLIHERLLKVAQGTTESVTFIISPLLGNVGHWPGWLPKKDWPLIHEVID